MNIICLLILNVYGKKKTKVNLNNNRIANDDKNNRVEKLFIYKGETKKCLNL